MEKMVKFNELENKVLSVLSQLEKNKDILKLAGNSEKEFDILRKEIETLKEENARLKNKLRDSQTNNLNLNEEVKRLKVVNAMSGNQEYKQMMKQRMNKLIKEVDTCIAQIKTNNLKRMSTQRIEIKIASRHYPMTINADEQEMLLACADEINTILKQFEQKYAVSDKQDALAMVTIQLALREAKLKKQVKDNEEMTTERISKLLELIDQSITK